MSFSLSYIPIGYITWVGVVSLFHAAPFSGALGDRDVTVLGDYKYTPGIGYHKLHSQVADWSTARKICREEGGHLAIINSVAEAEILSQLLTKKGVHAAFLGIHDIFKEGEWLTILDDPLSATGFTNWDPSVDQPDNFGGGENCGGLRFDKTLCDLSCSRQLHFICKLAGDRPTVPGEHTEHTEQVSQTRLLINK